MDLDISHLDVHTNDLAAATAFYTQVLGFDVLFATPPDSPAPLDLVWLRNSQGVTIELTREKSGYDAQAANRASLTHIAFKTSNLDADVAWLKGRGVTFELEPTPIALPDGQGGETAMRVSFFRGPSGERFELLQEL
jgi:catechol 2,3-dioxygenase-like lactoylglutathione lyase family enzyme